LVDIGGGEQGIQRRLGLPDGVFEKAARSRCNLVEAGEASPVAKLSVLTWIGNAAE
jgi:hypothetical protein